MRKNGLHSTLVIPVCIPTQYIIIFSECCLLCVLLQALTALPMDHYKMVERNMISRVPDLSMGSDGPYCTTVPTK